MTSADLSDLVVRPAVADDLDEVLALFVATRRAAVPAMPPMVGDGSGFRRVLEANVAKGDLWVAEEDRIVGFAVLAGPWLHSLYVGPDHQGSGIGSVLLDLAKAQRPQGFGLWVFEANTQARAFYRRHGLIELEHTDGSGNMEKTPDLRMAWPGEDPTTYLRSEIDAVDDDLAVLLARRFALTAAVQGYKQPRGHEGRDAEREREIADRMSGHAPGIGPAAFQRIMHTVIETSLDHYEGR